MQLADHLYLVDPMGNWMMRFPAGMDAIDASAAKDIKRDLERLLRASASWDRAGPQTLLTMDAQPLYDLSPALRMMLMGVVIALGPLAWVWLRNKAAGAGAAAAGADAC